MSTEAISIFIDEVKPSTNASGESWMYIGMLCVKDAVVNRLVEELLKIRRDMGYEIEVAQGDNSEEAKNEIKYCKLGHDNRRSEVAYQWINFFVGNSWNNSSGEFPFFYILIGLRMDWLSQGDVFGSANKELNIYNRFLRTAIGHTKSWLSGKHIVISRIIHDVDEEKMSHQFLPWHVLRWFNHKDDRINVVPSKMEFCASYKDEILQFVDLITGCWVNALDYSSKDDIKVLFANTLRNSTGNGRGISYTRGRLLFFPNLSVVSASVIDPDFDVGGCIFSERPFLIANHDQNELEGIDWSQF
jgi:hypothetical protein